MVSVFANGYVVDEKGIRNMVQATLKQHGLEGNFEVNINFISAAEMKRLHDKKLHEVLSFPLGKEVGPDGVMRLGDIVVLGKLPPVKRDELIAHACWHLLGLHYE